MRSTTGPHPPQPSTTAPSRSVATPASALNNDGSPAPLVPPGPFARLTGPRAAHVCRWPGEPARWRPTTAKRRPSPQEIDGTPPRCPTTGVSRQSRSRIEPRVLGQADRVPLRVRQRAEEFARRQFLTSGPLAMASGVGLRVGRPVRVRRSAPARPPIGVCYPGSGDDGTWAAGSGTSGGRRSPVVADVVDSPWWLIARLTSCEF